MTGGEENKNDKSLTTRMLTTTEVARIFNVHPGTIRRWSRRGILKPYRHTPNGEFRFSREEVAVLYLEKALKDYLKEESARD